MDMSRRAARHRRGRRRYRAARRWCGRRPIEDTEAASV